MSKSKFMATTVNITHKLDREISTILKRSRIDKRFLSAKKEITYSDFLSNKMQIILLIREGIPYSFFNLIQQHTPFSENDWANFLDISDRKSVV